MSDKLSLEGLIFQATKVDVSNNILTLTLNRPEKKNALNNVMMNEINYALAYAKQERDVRVVVIAAEGDIFCAGADLRREKSESNVPVLKDANDISLALRHLYKQYTYTPFINIKQIQYF
jgi:enoyl-CoA hydratase/carnithine racemase